MIISLLDIPPAPYHTTQLTAHWLTDGEGDREGLQRLWWLIDMTNQIESTFHAFKVVKFKFEGHLVFEVGFLLPFKVYFV